MAGGSPKNVGVTNPIKIFSNIFISFIGAGVLGLPYAFKEAGVMEGVIVMTVVAVFSSKAMLMVIECKYEVLQTRRRRRKYSRSKATTSSNGELTELKLPLMHEESESEDEALLRDDEFLSYGDIGYFALGNTGRSLVDLAIIVSQTGFCCAYLIFITENLASYIPSLTKNHWLIIILPPLFLISMLRQLDRLAFFSLFAQLTNIFAFTVVFWFDFQHYHTIRFRPREFSWKGFPLYFAIAIYCYEGAGMILSLEHSLAPHLRPRFKGYFLFTMVVVTLLYITFGASGYLSFGPWTKEIITMNLPHSGGADFAALVKLCLSLALFCTYPIMLFPVVQLLETRCTPVMAAPQQVWLQNMYRVVVVSVTGLIVVAVPNFAHLMALVGATCCTLLAFILPALFHTMIFKKYQTTKRFLMNFVLFGIGLLGLVIGTMDAVNRMGETTPDANRQISEVPGSVTLYPTTDRKSLPHHLFNTTQESTNASDQNFKQPESFLEFKNISDVQGNLSAKEAHEGNESKANGEEIQHQSGDSGSDSSVFSESVSSNGSEGSSEEDPVQSPPGPAASSSVDQKEVQKSSLPENEIQSGGDTISPQNQGVNDLPGEASKEVPTDSQLQAFPKSGHPISAGNLGVKGDGHAPPVKTDGLSEKPKENKLDTEKESFDGQRTHKEDNTGGLQKNPKLIGQRGVKASLAENQKQNFSENGQSSKDVPKESSNNNNSNQKIVNLAAEDKEVHTSRTQS